jgi:hypothetical protein
MERFLGQWSRKQLENPGVNNKCINTMREVYVYQAKLNSLMKPFSKEKQEAYAKCFGMQMGWVRFGSSKAFLSPHLQEFKASSFDCLTLLFILLSAAERKWRTR